jgi:murein DD-endopeptidase MepM/ murein hydrolase activator NlpD
MGAAVLAAVLLLPVVPGVPAAARKAPRVEFDPLAARVGAAVPVVLAAELAPGAATARAGGEDFPLIPLEPGRWLALAAVDASWAGTTYPVEFPGVMEDGRPLRVDLPLAPVEFGIQRITLPRKLVDYPPEAVPRIEQESRRLRDALAGRARDLFPRIAFISPLAGEARVSGLFGVKRVLNGEERAPHGGEDLAAPRGARVRAANRVRVALVGNFYLTGKTVVVDHGQGVFTLYSHLDKIYLDHGQAVARGKAVGTVGSTGRATGPHLHYGVIIRGVKVDPESLRALEPLLGEPSPAPVVSSPGPPRNPK